MKKILVSTDLSASSKGGIRFAIQLAKQTGSSLVFYYAIELNKPTRWTEEKFIAYVEGEISTARQKVEEFINGIYKDSGIRAGVINVVVERVISFRDAIINYAVANQFDYLCMSTRGAGKLKRLLGSNTSWVIKHSPIPVFAIPANYKRVPVKEILYASDLTAISTELETVKGLAASLKAKVNVLHYDYLYQLEEIRSKFDATARHHKASGIKFHLEQFDIENSLSTHLKNAVKKFNPSLVVLFTNQDRDWFERLFLSSKAAEASFDSTKPLLIYGKNLRRAYQSN